MRFRIRNERRKGTRRKTAAAEEFWWEGGEAQKLAARREGIGGVEVRRDSHTRLDSECD